MKASVNFKFSSFAPRHRLSELISTLGLASVNLQFSSFASRHNSSKLDSALDLASVATAARSISAACDEGRFIFPEERALAPLALVSQRSGACSLYENLN